MPPGADAGTIYSEVRVKLDKLTADLVAVSTKFDEFAKQNTAHAQKVEKGWQQSFSKIDLAGVAALAGLGAAIKSTFTAFTDFEQGMANVAAVARATPADFLKLEQAAMDAGESTRFSAREAADALYALASAGMNATQATEALDGVLLAAGATQSDLAFTSETITAILSQYNLKAGEAARVSNVLVAGINASQATMAKLANSLSYVGPVASSFNMKIEDTVGILSILYNNGLEASTAGTALRSAITDLSNAASPANKKLKEMGVNFDQINPATHSFAEIIEVLNAKVNNGADIMAVFGDRAGPAMIKLVEGGRKAIEDMTAAVTGTNAAAEAYAMQNNTTAGTIDELKSAVESAQIKFSKEFAPAIREVLKFITGLVKAVGDLPGPVKIFIGVLAAAIPVLIGVNMAMGVLTSLLTVAAGPVGIVIAGMAGVAAIAITVAKGIDESNKRWMTQDEWIQKNVKSIEEYKKSVGTVFTQGKSLKELQDMVKAADEEIKKLNKSIKESEEDLKSFNKAAASPIKPKVEQPNKLLPFNPDVSMKMTVDVQGNRVVANDAQKEQIKLLDQEKKKTEELIALKNKVNEIEALKYQISAEVAKRIGEQKEAEIKKTAEQLEAEKKIAEFTTKYKEKLEDLNATKLQAVELDRARALEEIKTSEDFAKASVDARTRAEAAVNSYYDALKEKTALELDKKAAEQVESYKNKIAELIDTQYNRIEAERRQALEAAEDLGLEKDAYQELVKQINAYYDALEDKAATDKFLKNVEDVVSAVKNIGGALNNLIQEFTDAAEADLDAQLQAELERQGVAEETVKARLQREINEARAAGNTKLADEKEKELKRYEITEEFEKKKARLQYEAAIAQWWINEAMAISEGALAILKAWGSAPFPVNLIAVGATTAAVVLQQAAMWKGQPQPPKFETGGIVPGNSMSGDNMMIAANSGEMVLTKEQQAQLFNMINMATATPFRQSSGEARVINIYLNNKLWYSGIYQASKDGIVTIHPGAVR